MRPKHCDRGLRVRISKLIATADDGARGRLKTGTLLGGFTTRVEKYAAARMHAGSAASAFGRGDCRRARESFARALKAFRLANR